MKGYRKSDDEGTHHRETKRRKQSVVLESYQHCQHNESCGRVRVGVVEGVILERSHWEVQIPQCTLVLRESLGCPPLQEREGTRKWKLLKNKASIGEDVIGNIYITFWHIYNLLKRTHKFLSATHTQVLSTLSLQR